MPMSGHSIHDPVASETANAPMVTGGWPYGHTFARPGTELHDEDLDEPTMLELVIVGVVLISVMASPIVISAAAAKFVFHRLRRR